MAKMERSAADVVMEAAERVAFPLSAGEEKKEPKRYPLPADRVRVVRKGARRG